MRAGTSTAEVLSRIAITRTAKTHLEMPSVIAPYEFVSLKEHP